jgi:hypothetical protein
LLERWLSLRSNWVRFILGWAAAVLWGPSIASAQRCDFSKVPGVVNRLAYVLEFGAGSF